MNRIPTHLLLLVVALSQLLNGASPSKIDPATLHLKEAVAVRVLTPPIIDGDLTDPIWKKAVPISDFLQVEPEDLGSLIELTEVRIIYDDNNIYVAIRAFDSEPEKIVGRLARRDSWMEAGENNADWVGVMFDSRNDNRTAFTFFVNVSGVKFDAYIYDDEEIDISWNGIWDVEVNRDELGWVAEFELPFSMFRFSAVGNQEWGMLLDRRIQRKQEKQMWPGIKRGTEGFVSRFGVLRGIEDVPPPKQLEILPYILGGIHKNDDDRLTKNTGLDVEYGLGSNTTLNVAFNPDFGQVEADPSVLNLSAFETFYDEKRPFFVKGESFFKNRIQFFHSRRIGKEPGYFSPSHGEIIESPDLTTILSAVKIMGKTESGLSFGVIESVTDEEYGIWEYEIGDSTLAQDFLLEPYTNYFIGRVEKPIINDVSTIGAMVTDVRRKEATGAFSGGLDWGIRLFNNRFAFSGQLAQSDVNGDKGYAGRFYAGYSDPVWWNVNIIGAWFSDSFDINELGFLERNGFWKSGIFGKIRRQDPWGPFLRNELEYRFFYKSRNDGLPLAKHLRIEQNNSTKNYWRFGFGAEVDFPSYDDDDTFQDSLAWDIASPFSKRGWIFLKSDSRKRVIVAPVLGFGMNDLGGWGYKVQFGLILKPTNYLMVSVEATENYDDSRVEWVEAVDEDSIIYSNSKQKINEIQLRMNLTFSPELSLQMYLQPFRADMEYFDFKRLTAPKTLDFEPYEYNGDPDFKIRNSVGTFVLRWEYLPGSTLFIVYNLNDSNHFSSLDSSWESYKSNTLFIKLNYWFQI